MANDSAHPLQFIRIDFSTASATTAALTLGTVSGGCSVVEIYNSSLGTFQLKLGNQTVPYGIFPSGGNGRVGLNLDSGQTIAIVSVTNSTISAGVLMLNLLR